MATSIIKPVSIFVSVIACGFLLNIVMLRGPRYNNMPHPHCMPGETTSMATESPRPTNDPYAGWATLSNADIDLSFRYPNEWGVPQLELRLGATGKQFEGHFASAAVSFGGNSSDYTSTGAGASFYDFYSYSPADLQFAVSFAPGNNFSVAANEAFTLESGFSVILLTGQSRDQLYDDKDAVAYVNTKNTSFGGVAVRYKNGATDLETFVRYLRSFDSCSCSN